MTNRATLEALLARVVQGEGPDRELDAEIWIASERGASDLAAPPWRYLGGGCWNDDSEPHGHNKVYAPHYTASLDAALTLVPEGWSWHVALRFWPAPTRATGSVWSESIDGSKLFYVDATTPARALIAACIKARMEAQGE